MELSNLFIREFKSDWDKIPEASIFSFSNGAVSPVSYEETESYQITKMFFENRDRLFEELFED